MHIMSGRKQCDIQGHMHLCLALKSLRFPYLLLRDSFESIVILFGFRWWRITGYRGDRRSSPRRWSARSSHHFTFPFKCTRSVFTCGCSRRGRNSGSRAFSPWRCGSCTPWRESRPTPPNILGLRLATERLRTPLFRTFLSLSLNLSTSSCLLLQLSTLLFPLSAFRGDSLLFFPFLGGSFFFGRATL